MAVVGVLYAKVAITGCITTARVLVLPRTVIGVLNTLAVLGFIGDGCVTEASLKKIKRSRNLKPNSWGLILISALVRLSAPRYPKAFVTLAVAELASAFVTYALLPDENPVDEKKKKKQ